MKHDRQIIFWILTLGLVLNNSKAAQAQVFSPGALSKPHESLEGLKNCTQCHVQGERLSDAQCLDCHEVLAQRVEAKKGYHGRLSSKTRACVTCHLEHKGKGFALIDWGPKGRNRFDHNLTGYRLNGAHRRTDCEKCHVKGFIQTPAVKKLLKERPKTFLGLSDRCATCHFDEHRGQEPAECETCHDEVKWKPAPRFDHDDTTYPLTGAHAQVECTECHETLTDPKRHTGPLVPRAKTYTKMKDIPHAQCTDCHKDPHKNRFGADCERCHSTQDWTSIEKTLIAKRAFHDATRYPLRGAHARTDCTACHGVGRRAKYRGLAFDACTDCHLDAHVGQLTDNRCDRCHDVESFSPANFGITAHEDARYRLEGAHQLVGCLECHTQDPALDRRVPKKARRRLHRQGRPVVVSTTKLVFERTDEACDRCHDDPHGGQLDDAIRLRGCQGCHSVTGFEKITFNHDTDSAFILEGAHRRADCKACHLAPSSEAPVRYRPLPQDCQSCHEDIHLGQFSAPPNGHTNCGRCHGSESFETTKFDHNNPAFTAFALDGAHEAIDCEKCHPMTPSASGWSTRKYTNVPTTCEGCHDDFHNGAMKELAP